jgi:CheY-like chemotaxis protein/anti-sigma regulatory factor (Ser/Thr protein kinase)
MPTVLIVDDSSMDRRLAGGLLEDEPDMKVQYAQDGEEALRQMERSVPDVVLTDMIMPVMGGLDLVSQIRKQFPLVPTVLMTSVGNEESAVRALQKGAASYVPKRALAHSLVETVRNVLEVSRRERGQTRLMDFLVHNELEFELDNDRNLIAPLVGYLQEGISRLKICNESDQMRIGIALDEALVNALYHGNLELSSELRERDGEAYQALAEQRTEQPPYCTRHIHVQAKLNPTEAVFVVRDEGPGFDPTKLPDPTNPNNLEKVSGRGILLMRTFMDDVAYNDAGNCVRLVKRSLSHAAARRNS